MVCFVDGITSGKRVNIRVNGDNVRVYSQTVWPSGKELDCIGK